MTRPRFSIVICNYNYGRFVGDAIQSCLDQDYPKGLFEVIVIDDGSSDESREVIGGFAPQPNLTTVLQENRGHAGAFAAGIEFARHDLVCLLDSDDLFLPGKLARVAARVEALSPLPERFFLCHDIEIYDQGTGMPTGQTWFQVVGIEDQGDTLSLEMARSQFPFSGPCGEVFSRALIREILDRLPLSDWRMGVDSPIAHCALLASETVHYLHEPLACYRVHGANDGASLRDGRYVPKEGWHGRTPKLLRDLGRTIDTLELDAYERASRIAYVKRKERLGRTTSAAHRLSRPRISFVVDAGAVQAPLERTLRSIAAQTEADAEVVVTTQGSPFERHVAGYRKATGEYLAFAEAGTVFEPAFAARHLHAHCYGGLVNASFCDARLVDAAGAVLRTGSLAGFERWKQPQRHVPPMAAPLRERWFPPPAAGVLRRSCFTDVFLAGLESRPSSHVSAIWHWLLLQFVHSLTGSLLLEGVLVDCPVPQQRAGGSNAPHLGHAPATKTEFESAAGVLFAAYCGNQAMFREYLPPAWHVRFIRWMKEGQSRTLSAQLKTIAAGANATLALRLLEG